MSIEKPHLRQADAPLREYFFPFLKIRINQTITQSTIPSYLHCLDRKYLIFAAGIWYQYSDERYNFLG
mgnify:CR=1